MISAQLKISDPQQSRGYEDGPWKGPGPPLLGVRLKSYIDN
jgi:hypothetical protein